MSNNDIRYINCAWILETNYERNENWLDSGVKVKVLDQDIKLFYSCVAFFVGDNPLLFVLLAQILIIPRNC